MTVNVCLVALCVIFNGIQETFYFCDFPGGGGVVQTPYPPPSGSAHDSVHIKMYLYIFLIFEGCSTYEIFPSKNASMVFGLCTCSFSFQQVNTLKANCQWLKNVRSMRVLL